ncbi:hypothetical protein K491DRAFT_747121 [Lophiostoma macrostomum CBS 122681]|uniref:Uncharacterized protein n=1 Tax=Lophiostoma macrostomum CBS 122681 TaxID=1314788 RepID=A0A6A6T981_9PLEO|nr:hypothetical protein K491DRAFT_747121 [Lophiostoma macrostomum CBS 122681]
MDNAGSGQPVPCPQRTSTSDHQATMANNSPFQPWPYGPPLEYSSSPPRFSSRHSQQHPSHPPMRHSMHNHMQYPMRHPPTNEFDEDPQKRLEDTLREIRELEGKLERSKEQRQRASTIRSDQPYRVPSEGSRQSSRASWERSIEPIGPPFDRRIEPSGPPFDRRMQPDRSLFDRGCDQIDLFLMRGCNQLDLFLMRGCNQMDLLLIRALNFRKPLPTLEVWVPQRTGIHVATQRRRRRMTQVQMSFVNRSVASSRNSGFTSPLHSHQDGGSSETSPLYTFVRVASLADLNRILKFADQSTSAFANRKVPSTFINVEEHFKQEDTVFNRSRSGKAILLPPRYGHILNTQTGCALGRLCKLRHRLLYPAEIYAILLEPQEQGKFFLETEYKKALTLLEKKRRRIPNSAFDVDTLEALLSQERAKTSAHTSALMSADTRVPSGTQTAGGVSLQRNTQDTSSLGGNRTWNNKRRQHGRTPSPPGKRIKTEADIAAKGDEGDEGVFIKREPRDSFGGFGR